MALLTEANIGRTYADAKTLTRGYTCRCTRSMRSWAEVSQLLRFSLCCILISAASARAGDDVARVIQLRTGEKLAVASFSLSEEAELNLRLDSVSQRVYEMSVSRSGLVFSVGWIINARTREKIWHEKEASNMDAKGNNVFNLRLPKGDYEMYLAMVHRGAPREEAPQRRLRVEAPPPPPLRKTEYPTFKLSGPKAVLSFRDKDFSGELISRALVSINHTGDNSSETRVFQVMSETKLHIYAVGEAKRRSSSVFDYGWIEDLTRERIIWSMNPRECEFAGGSSKNIVARDTILLAPGKYALHFETDDSHAYGDWTEEPPYDPSFWGITLWAFEEKDAVHIKVLREKVASTPVLEIAEVGNNRHIIKGIELSKSMGFRLICLGEGTWRDGMVDFGWIENATTGKPVWTMKFPETISGGGSEKNRLSNQLIHLDQGRYLVHYQTDDSHAFGDWNAAEPSRPNTWGISLSALEQKDAGAVRLLEISKKVNKPLVALLKVGNNAYLEKLFTLNSATRLQVVAFGEAEDKSLADQGWIENDDTGRIVWKMDPAKTKHAGGSEKNRILVQTISLPAGTYKLLYESNDSNAYNQWDGAPPHEPENYGIALYPTRF